MVQRYEEFLEYANKNGFFDEKYRIESDFNGRNRHEMPNNRHRDRNKIPD
jgi:hypothetical protein